MTMYLSCHSGEGRNSEKREPKSWMPIFIGMTLSIGFFFALLFLPSSAFASTNISSVANQHWAWNDDIGWIDFYNGGTSNVMVTASSITGSNVTSSAGIVSLNCASAVWGCGISYGVTNDGTGNLGGYAWNDTIGWISFYWGNTAASSTQAHSSVCTSYGLYCGVYIDQNGNFHGYAWNDSIGWISFNCLDIGGSFCTGTSNYEVSGGWAPVVATGMLDSSTFDTGSAAGAELNSILWSGSLNGLASYNVAFQIAVSTSTSGPWNFKGPDGTASSTYWGSPNASIPITNYAAYVGYRYFRYRVILLTNISQSTSPKVTGISVNWSP